MEVRGRRALWGSIAAIALMGAALLLAACGGGSSAEASCEPTLYPHLTPGTGPAAYTLGIRVNKDTEVDELDQLLGDRILDRDVFVINAEYPGSKPDDWENSLNRLTEKFPCNRVVTLTGLGSDPEKPSYQYALVGHPELDAVMVDWEQDSYEDAGRGHWTPALQTNLVRIAAQLRALSARLKDTHTRMGLFPDYLPPWDYGRTARVIAEANYLLDPIHRGYQIIQTQPNCGTASAPGPSIGPLTAQLIGQYKGTFGLPLRVGAPKDLPPDMDRDLLQHVGFEIAFDQNPNPKASDAVERVGPEQAANCSDEILKAGGAGIAYWADPPSIRAMLDTPMGLRLRPHTSS
jgi:hypothetical protein